MNNQSDPAGRSTEKSGSFATPSRLVNLRVHEADLRKKAESYNETSHPEMAAYGDIETSAGTNDLAAMGYANAGSNSAASMPMIAPEATKAAPAAVSESIKAAPAAAAKSAAAKDLELEIAADYTAASLDATMVNLPARIEARDTLSAAIYEAKGHSTVDQIAATASEAIAAIRSTTNPEDVAAQIASLKEFAKNIKQNPEIPEIVELADTIDKFIVVAEKSTMMRAEKERRVRAAAAASLKQAAEDRAQQAKVKLNTGAGINAPRIIIKSESSEVAESKPEKPVKSRISLFKRATAVKTAKKEAKPAKVKVAASKSAKSSKTARGAIKVAVDAPRTAKAARPTMAKNARSNSSHLLTAKPVGKTAVKKPVRNAAVTDEAALRAALKSVENLEEDSAPIRRKRKKGGVGRFALAFGCAAACVAGIIYLVGSNIPDVSIRVAAMQTGVDAAYPSYVPRGYSLKGISSESGKIVLSFEGPDDTSFTLSEEKCAWDSIALQRNFVEPTWQSDFTTVHEQGITMFIHGSSAAWMNRGVLHKIESVSGTLTKKQLKSVVTSM